MKLIDIINVPWAITPDYLSNIVAASLHFQESKELFHADKHDDEEDRRRRGFQVIGNTAIIQVFGPITPEEDFFSFFFGGTSFDVIKRDIVFATEEGFKPILHIRSPGGTVEGSFETADLIKELAKDHDIITFSDGMIASAAALLASATNKTFITGKTNQVGSIGVIARRLDVTKARDDIGFKIEEFVSGKFKNIFSPDKKITDFDREAIQEQVDFLSSLFARDFSENRGISVENVVNWEAKIFIGQQAIDEGLVDGVSTLESLVEQNNSQSTFRGGIMPNKISLESLKEENPELVAKIKGDELLNGKDMGVQEERARISEIQELAFKGQEDLVKKLIADGTTVAEAGSQLIKDFKAKGSTQQETKLPDAVKFLENQDSGEEQEEEKKDFMVQVNEYQIQHRISRKDALRAIVKLDPKGHRAWVDNQKPVAPWGGLVN